MLSYPSLYVRPERWAWVIPYDEAQLADRVGAGWEQAKGVRPADPTTEDTSVFGGTTFPNYIPIEDRKYYLAWMEAALGQQRPGRRRRHRPAR